MLLKAMKIFAVVILTYTFFTMPALSDTGLILNGSNTLVSQASEVVDNLIVPERFSVKKGQPYDEPNDPAFKSSSGGPEQSSPQHGYFAVPLIVIGLAGILLYFSKFD